MDQKSDVVLFAERHADDTELLENGKLRFLLTGMEFSPTTTRTLLEAHANGRAMKRAKNQHHDYSIYLPHVVPHKVKDPSFFLYCKLTNTTIPKIPEKVQSHVSGKRFRARLADWQRREKLRKEHLASRSKKRAEQLQADVDGPDDLAASADDADVLDAISITDDSESDEQDDAQSLSGDENESDDVSDPKNETISSDSEDEMELEGKTKDLNGNRAAHVRKRRINKGRRISNASRAKGSDKNSPHTFAGKRGRSDGKVPKKDTRARQRFRPRTATPSAT